MICTQNSLSEFVDPAASCWMIAGLGGYVTVMERCDMAGFCRERDLNHSSIRIPLCGNTQFPTWRGEGCRYNPDEIKRDYYKSLSGFWPHIDYALGMMPKFYLAAAGWQIFADYAQDVQKLSKNTLGFSLYTGLGGSVGVFVGNALTHLLRWLIAWWRERKLRNQLIFLVTDDGDVDDEESLSASTSTGDIRGVHVNHHRLSTAIMDSLFYAIAAFVTDGIWQSLVNLFSHCSLPLQFVGVGLGSGIAFFIIGVIAAGLLQMIIGRFTERVIVEKVIVNGKLNWAFIRSHFVISLWNVAMASAFFIFSTSGYVFNANSEDMQIWWSGLSELSGYALSQAIELGIKWLMIHFGVMPKSHLPELQLQQAGLVL